MRFDGIDQDLGLLEPANKVGADLGVRPFRFTVDRLADIVQQPAPLGHDSIQFQFRRHEAAQHRHFLGVSQDVLAVRRPVIQLTQLPDNVQVQSVNSQFETGLLPRLADNHFHFALRFVHDLLDARRVDTAIRNQLLQRHTGNLPANRVVAGENHRLRGIIDDNVNPGAGLECPDIASLTSDNAPLHLIVGQVDHRDGRLHRVIRGAPVDRGENDLLGFLFGVLFRLLPNLLDMRRRFHLGLADHVLHELAFGLFGGHLGDFLEFIVLAGNDAVELRLPERNPLLTGLHRLFAAGQIPLAPLDEIVFLLQRAIALIKPFFELVELPPLLLHFLFERPLYLQPLLPRLQSSLFLLQ